VEMVENNLCSGGGDIHRSLAVVVIEGIERMVEDDAAVAAAIRGTVQRCRYQYL
jgi:hypothetical protein